MIRKMLGVGKVEAAQGDSVTDSPRLSVEGWVRAGGRAEFSCPQYGNEARWVKCSLTRSHEGSTVFADEMAPLEGDAFLKAVARIERTIGLGWRAR